ncbi:MAG: RNA methyltransferase [Phascolarctobacterium sp.]|nr:RNA methyltransferase [Candidatus Phascolarctobacterium caballi]
MIKTTKAAVKTAAFLKQKKYRQERQEFLVEGIRAVEEAVEYGNTKTIFFVPTDDERVNALLKKAEKKGIVISEAYEGYMAQIADTSSPQGVIAVCGLPKYNLDDIFGTGKMILVLDRVQDPGNFGTMLRTADAAGIGGVVALSGSVDAFSSKAVRSSMGSLFHIPVVENITEAEFLESSMHYHYETVTTALIGGESIYDTKVNKKTAVIVGNEANGVSSVLFKSANKRVYIPMKGRAESLNVAVAAAIVLFELNR